MDLILPNSNNKELLEENELRLGVNSLIGTSFWESLQKELNNIAIDGKKFNDGAVGHRKDSKVDKKTRKSKVL